jgi:hypothetical protein
MLTVFASAAGPLLFAAGKRATNAYGTVFFGLSGLVLFMAVAVWFVPLPRFASARPPDENPR